MVTHAKNKLDATFMTVSRLVELGTVRAIRFSRTMRVYQADYRDFLEAAIIDPVLFTAEDFAVINDDGDEKGITNSGARS